MKAGSIRPVALGALAAGAFGALVWLEHRRALRRERKEPTGRHIARNLAVAGATAVVVQLLERPAIDPLTRLVERRGWGLLPRLRLPGWLESALAVALMDYTLYWWHILLHRFPPLWRAHAVHHVDLDMDASTALRFHFAEFLASIPWRAAQVLLIGVTPRSYRIWGRFTALEVLFHHSNLRLPIALERPLARVLVTPRLHGIHHSIVPEEQHSNFSSGLTLWDFLHGTVRMNVAQEEITIGVPAYRDPRDVTLPRVLAMPFREERRPTWRLPGDGVPRRASSPAPADRLLP